MMNFYDSFFFGAAGRNKLDSRQAALDKRWTGINIFYRLIDMVISRFEYDIPDTCDARFLEMTLLYNDAGIIEVDGKPANLEVVGQVSWDRYGYPCAFNLQDFMGKDYGRFIPDIPSNEGFADCVYIRGSKVDIPAISRIYWYANRLTDIQASISAAIANLKGTTIVQCSKEQEKVVKKAYMNASNGLPVILAFGRDDGSAFSVDPKVITNPQTPEILISLQEAYDKTFSEFLTEFGINANGVINKLAGVSDAELSQNNQSINIRLQSDLKVREDALKRAQKMFGGTWKIKVVGANEELKRPENDDKIEGNTEKKGEDDNDKEV